MNLRFVDLSVPIQEPNPGEIRGGTGAILAAEIQYQSHTDTLPECKLMFGAEPEDMDGVGVGAERLALTAHAGTHVDAPWHYHPTSEGRPARTIDQLELEHFFAPGVVVDLRGHEPGGSDRAGRAGRRHRAHRRSAQPGRDRVPVVRAGRALRHRALLGRLPGPRRRVHPLADRARDQGDRVRMRPGWIAAIPTSPATSPPPATARCSGRHTASGSSTSTSRSRSWPTSARCRRAASTSVASA